MKFTMVSDYTPKGDQPQAIEKLSSNILAGKKAQILLGATGTGKTYTIANVIA
ncbi:MAG TPA: DEAD/DEAH box helicase family protein, partial [Firmicutes bacterium]|nr:DEAD/DEAH box helicase family protein [Bacillota bacterium]